MSALKSSHLDFKALQLTYCFEHGINFSARVITISSDIDQDTFRLLDIAFAELELDKKKPVTIRLNSFGGSVYDALAIIGRMKSSGLKITVEGYGAVMSAATIILAAGHIRRLSEFSWLMSHSMSYGVEGKHAEIKSLVIQREREEQQWSNTMARFSNKPASWWNKLHSSQDKYLTPKECLHIGVIDEII